MSSHLYLVFSSHLVEQLYKDFVDYGLTRNNIRPAIEEAQALDRLVREFELTHQEIAEAIGRSRASVSNLIRLLDAFPKDLAICTILMSLSKVLFSWFQDNQYS